MHWRRARDACTGPSEPFEPRFHAQGRHTVPHAFHEKSATGRCASRPLSAPLRSCHPPFAQSGLARRLRQL
eukprot:1885412-Pleurochrysis_carterae.AAC.2